MPRPLSLICNQPPAVIMNNSTVMNAFWWNRLYSSSVLARSSAISKGWKRSKGRRRFVDLKRVRVCGGNGGDGLMSFKCPTSTKVNVGGPDGGDGGCGGGVVFVADSSMKSLCSLRGHYRAKDGSNGQGSYRQGASGRDVVIKVPPGTLLRDHLSPTRDILHDLLTPGSSCQVAQGGEGGLGNARFSTTADRKPSETTLGVPGSEHVLEVELRMIAEVGLVGFPNAGKSTLLRALSRAMPKVGDYPFTTVHPEIGVVEREEEEEVEEVAKRQVTVADIPGLVPGAHLNKGLGHSFLKHIQRCSALLLILDGASPDSDMLTQLRHLEEELEMYDKQLLASAQLIIANKMDSHEKVGRDFEADLNSIQERTGLPVIPISALHKWNIAHLKKALFRITKHE